MARAQYNVLIIPFRHIPSGHTSDRRLEVAVTRRSDNGDWQFLSGGGEGDETPLEAARREGNEEGAIPYDSEMIQLDAKASVPAICFHEHTLWGSDVYIVTEYSFAVDVGERGIVLSDEHTDVLWLGSEEASKQLKFDSNRVALWELTERIARGAVE